MLISLLRTDPASVLFLYSLSVLNCIGCSFCLFFFFSFFSHSLMAMVFIVCCSLPGFPSAVLFSFLQRRRLTGHPCLLAERQVARSSLHTRKCLRKCVHACCIATTATKSCRSLHCSVTGLIFDRVGCGVLATFSGCVNHSLVTSRGCVCARLPCNIAFRVVRSSLCRSR